MGRLKKVCLLCVLMAVLASNAFIFYFSYWFNHPVLEKNQSFEYYVPQGSSFSKIVYDLSKQRIITHPRLFIFYSSLLNKTSRIKFGTYGFSDSDTPKSILLKLVQGDTILIKITLPEGLNMYQVALKLEKYFPSVSKELWQTLFSNDSFIQFIGLKDGAKNIEGFLFPQTYFFDPHADPRLIIKAILTEFKKNVTPQMFDKAKSMGLTPLQFMTLASIVEKETALKSERYMVAAVYWNRIKRRMKLQADPTVIYGIWDKYMGSLTKKDLLTPTPYNTYTFVGLPPAPIANPGLDSILAVLNPAQTEDLYFVANGQGGSTFSKTLDEHNKAVKRYIHFLREEKKKLKL